MFSPRIVAMSVLGGALCVSAYRLGARRLMGGAILGMTRALGVRATSASAIGSPLPRAPEHGSCIYLDYQATSPVWPEVAEAAVPYLTLHWGNPSSGHAFGRSCAAAVNHARSAVAQLIGAKPDEIIFTGCGSEADNHAILGVIEDYEARQRQSSKGGGKGVAVPLPHVVTSNVEHPAVTECLEALRAAGRLEVSYVPVDDEGRVEATAVAAAVTARTVLVTVMHSNNEVGSVQPISEISTACKAARPGVLVHTDAAQSIGKLPVRVDDLGVDMLTMVGHKFGAPKGVAALYVRRESAPTCSPSGARKLPNLLHGGGQEGGRRAGTECVVLLVALGRAAEIAAAEATELAAHMRATRDQLEALLAAGIREAGLGEVRRNGPRCEEHRLPNTLSLGIPGVRASALLAALSEDVAASAGAACHAEHTSVSAVLRAMRVPHDYAVGTLRLSTGRHTSHKEVERAAALIVAQAKLQHQR